MAAPAPMDAEQKPTLTEEEVAEIKKVFSVFDKDGDGTISTAELRTVIGNLGHTLSDTELQVLMKKMDANGDGTISWEEFLSALGAWVKEEDDHKTGRPSRKRKEAPGSPCNIRAKIHKQISSFFLQFKRETNFEQIREKYASMGSKGAAEAGSDAAGPDSGWAKAPTPEEKANSLTLSKQLMDHLPQMAIGINGNDPDVAYKCTQGVANLLGVCQTFQTPDERYEIAEFLLSIFQRIHEAGIIPRIIAFLTVDKKPELQFEAARVLSYFAPGPRIAHTPTDSPLHPDKRMHKELVIQHGALPHLGKLLASNCLEVREQAIVCLGKLASHDPEVRDLLLTMGIFPVLLNQINDGTPPGLLHRLTWAISIFCGYTHPLRRPPKYDVVAQALPKLAYLFQKNDENTLFNVCNALTYLLPGIVIEEAICSRLVQLLGINSLRIQKIVLHMISDIIRFNPDGTKKLLQANLMPMIREMLKHVPDHFVRLEICDLVSLIAGEKGEVGAVVDSEIVPELLTLLVSDEHVRWKIVKVLNYLTRGIPSHVTYLVESLNIVKVLSESLSHFKSYDSVLRDVYNFLGPTYNFEFAHDIASALSNIIKTGDMIPAGNPFVRFFGMECVDRIKSVLMLLAGELADSADAWRNTTETTDTKLEDTLVTLLNSIKSIHERSKAPASVHIVTQINETIKAFQAEQKKNAAKVNKKRQLKKQESKGAIRTQSAFGAGAGASSSSAAMGDEKKTVTIKCFLNGDNRVLEVPRDITLEDLRLRVQFKYNKAVILQYEDHDGDKITIDSADLLEKAMARADSTGVIRIHLLEKKGGPGAGVPKGSAFDFSARGEAKSSGLFDSLPITSYQSKHDVINELSYETKLSRSDLERLYHQFQKTATNGVLNKQQFAHGLKSIAGPGVDQVMIDQYFNAFDYDKDGFVDFRDFAVGLAVLHKGNAEERLQLAFKAYDLDGNGTIDREELFRILKSSFRAKGFEQSDEFITTLVDKSFEQADANGDGQLDFDEFKSAVLQHQIVLQSFWKSGV